MIETNNDKIELRNINLFDIENRFNLILRNKEFLKKWLGWTDYYNSVTDVIEYSKKCIIESEEQRMITYLIYYENSFAGQINMHNLDKKNNRCELGYWLGSEYNGKGIMSTAVSALLNNIFDSYDFTEVIISAEEGNESSCNVALGLGFDYLGVSENSLKREGKLRNVKSYSMNKTKWHSLSSESSENNNVNSNYR